MQCNICGGTQWGDQGQRKNVRCLDCNSLERTRVIKLHLDSLGLPEAGHRILHVAPEQGLADFLSGKTGDGYEAVDFEPEMYPFREVKKIDLCDGAKDFQSDTYDLILHSHVLEHVPCNWSAVVMTLQRMLKTGGYHVFSIPIMLGTYDEALGPLPLEEIMARFGQSDHVRRFGQDDIAKTLGMLFKGDLEKFIIGNCFATEELDRFNVPPSERSNFNGSTVFAFQKGDSFFS